MQGYYNHIFGNIIYVTQNSLEKCCDETTMNILYWFTSLQVFVQFINIDITVQNYINVRKIWNKFTIWHLFYSPLSTSLHWIMLCEFNLNLMMVFKMWPHFFFCPLPITCLIQSALFYFQWLAPYCNIHVFLILLFSPLLYICYILNLFLWMSLLHFYKVSLKEWMACKSCK